MMPLETVFDWSKLYSAWRILSMGTGWNQKISFTPVLVSSPSGGLRIGTEICDWWPPDDISHRRTALEEQGTMGVYWETKKGTAHTAELLYKCKDDLETQAAIFMAASLWDNMNPLPAAWRGEIYHLAHDIFQLIAYDPQSPFKKHDLEIWHHAMRNALPANIATEDFAEFSKPQHYRDFVYIAFLEATLSTSLWTPVVVSHEERNSLHG
jgi:hypothetical protein